MYLSRNEKLNIIAICGFADWLNTYIPHIKDKNIKKWLKTAQTYLNKAWNERVKDLPYNQGIILLNMAKQYEMEFIPRFKPKDKINKHDIYALAEYAQMNTCLTCQNQTGECELRELLKRLGIKGINQSGCPYDIWSIVK